MLVIVARFPYTDVTHFYVNYGFYRVRGTYSAFYPGPFSPLSKPYFSTKEIILTLKK